MENNLKGIRSNYLYPYDVTEPPERQLKGHGGKGKETNFINWDAEMYQDKACLLVRYNYGILKCTECPIPECYLDTMGETSLRAKEQVLLGINMGLPSGHTKV